MGFDRSHISQVAPSLGISCELEESADMVHMNFGGEARIASSSIL